MELSPEERRRIYEEEKAKIETEREKRSDVKPAQLAPNIAGLLCYLAGWITGIIFLIIEPRDKFVRFHAVQSIVVFGSLMILSGVVGWIPVAGVFFSAIFGILAFILWIVLMIKAYQGELYKLPVAGEIADSILESIDRSSGGGKTGGPGSNPGGSDKHNVSQAASLKSEPATRTTTRIAERQKKEYYIQGRTGRVVGYSLAIFWNVAVLIFFSFFSGYIAWYTANSDGGLTRTPLLTGEYDTWLPILITVLVISTAAYVLLIIYDRYWFRQSVQVFLDILGIIVVGSLVTIFPFDFSVIPNSTAADIVPAAVTAALILVAVGLAIAALVHFVSLIIHLARRETA